MTEAETTSGPTRTYPRSEWLRTIDFTDRGVAEVKDDGPPCHVACGAWLLNGEAREDVRILDRYGFTIHGQSADATVVSFVVHGEDAQIGHWDGDGLDRQFKIGGLNVLTPLDHPWETFHVIEHRSMPSWDAVRVYAYVAEVHIR